MTGECVGFADCPCLRCRATRVETTAEHPNHERNDARSYCGACRTTERERYRVSLAPVRYNPNRPKSRGTK